MPFTENDFIHEMETDFRNWFLLINTNFEDEWINEKRFLIQSYLISYRDIFELIIATLLIRMRRTILKAITKGRHMDEDVKNSKLSPMMSIIKADVLKASWLAAPHPHLETVSALMLTCSIWRVTLFILWTGLLKTIKRSKLR